MEEGKTDDEDEVQITGVKEADNDARKMPHSRHNCAYNAFNPGATAAHHENHCGMCYCYVCDKIAPCIQWKEHCHAYDDKGNWQAMRIAMRTQATAQTALGPKAAFRIEVQTLLSLAQVNSIRVRCNVLASEYTLLASDLTTGSNGAGSSQSSTLRYFYVISKVLAKKQDYESTTPLCKFSATADILSIRLKDHGEWHNVSPCAQLPSDGSFFKCFCDKKYHHKSIREAHLNSAQHLTGQARYFAAWFISQTDTEKFKNCTTLEELKKLQSTSLVEITKKQRVKGGKLDALGQALVKIVKDSSGTDMEIFEQLAGTIPLMLL